MPVHAFIFPGQGSQAPGMGRDLAAAFSAARDPHRNAETQLRFLPEWTVTLDAMVSEDRADITIEIGHVLLGSPYRRYEESKQSRYKQQCL